ncbi:MAG: efflux transporter periplasmic adaptor subunit, partial [Burkholderiales bacterium]|nr:efflux transporter periplasmic adaptor subunit [Burkholderiales bacterium]
MDQPPNDTPSSPPPRPISKRGRWVGSVIAIVGLALLGGLAWYLTHQPKATTAGAAAGPGGPGGPGGG